MVVVVMVLMMGGSGGGNGCGCVRVVISSIDVQLTALPAHECWPFG